MAAGGVGSQPLGDAVKRDVVHGHAFHSAVLHAGAARPSPGADAAPPAHGA
jgi:hypothetical protein